MMANATQLVENKTASGNRADLQCTATGQTIHSYAGFCLFCVNSHAVSSIECCGECAAHLSSRIE